MPIFNLPFVSVAGSHVERGIGVRRKKKINQTLSVSIIILLWSQNFFSDPFNMTKHNKATKTENII